MGKRKLAAVAAAVALSGAPMVEGGDMPETDGHEIKMEQVSETKTMTSKDYENLRQELLKKGATEGEIESALMDAAFVQIAQNGVAQSNAEDVYKQEMARTDNPNVQRDERNGFERGVDATVNAVNDGVRTATDVVLYPGRFVLYLGDEAMRYLAKGINEVGRATGTENITNIAVDGILLGKDTVFGLGNGALNMAGGAVNTPFLLVGNLAKDAAEMTRDPVGGLRDLTGQVVAVPLNIADKAVIEGLMSPMMAHAIVFTAQDGVRKVLFGTAESFADIVGKIDKDAAKKMQEYIEAGNGALAIKNAAEFLAGMITTMSGVAVVGTVVDGTNIVRGYMSAKNGEEVLTPEEKAFVEKRAEKAKEKVETALKAEPPVKEDTPVKPEEIIKEPSRGVLGFLSTIGRGVTETDQEMREERLNSPAQMPTITRPTEEKKDKETPEEKEMSRRIVGKELGATAYHLSKTKGH
ncbi:MAG: hypothetical protein J6P93_05860 [Alphaproteobacteria bacterium]|nr:hypothetical protein [Alphaproteobacteria bacterium]